jgi:hypothetical protein
MEGVMAWLELIPRELAVACVPVSGWSAMANYFSQTQGAISDECRPEIREI